MHTMTTRTSDQFRQILDERGRPLGTVVEPRTDRLTGRGAGTILLLRESRC